jgi:hypothetical protein
LLALEWGMSRSVLNLAEGDGTASYPWFTVFGGVPA